MNQILAVWTAPDTYNNRVAALRAGNGAPKLDATTVMDDGAVDHLFGGPGLDWFFAGPTDVLHGKVNSEQTN